MEIKKQLLRNPWDLINSLTNNDIIEEFELDDLLIDISLRILNYRINNNITQKQLAEKLNISQSMVSKLESGEYNPTIEQLWKISKKLGWNFEIKFEEEVEAQVWIVNDQLIEFNDLKDEKENDEIVKKLAEGA